MHVPSRCRAGRVGGGDKPEIFLSDRADKHKVMWSNPITFTWGSTD